MKNWLALLALTLTACPVEDGVDPGFRPATLREYAFAYDITAFAGFAPKPDTWSGDTLTHYDYWRLTEQPTFEAAATMERDTLQVRYVADSGVALDWSPTVETRLQILLGGNRNSLIVKIHPASHAAHPRPEYDPPAIQDATVGRVLLLRRP